MPRILLFIPMYNCEKQIVRVAEQLADETAEFISEAIFVNNRSTDGGENAIIEKLKTMSLPFPAKVLRNNENYGLGGSHKVAFNYAIANGFEYVIVLHGDDQGSIENILPYLKTREYENYDCFLGARFMRGSKLQGYSKFRTFGNRVYDLLFSVGTGKMVYDLGSGLNLYRVETLKSRFWEKYKDNLMFNYCMVLGSSFYRHRIKYFPILWREDDQVSNVKMMNQAVVVLKLLGSYILNKKKFIGGEHRDKIVETYSAEVVYTTK